MKFKSLSDEKGVCLLKKNFFTPLSPNEENPLLHNSNSCYSNAESNVSKFSSSEHYIPETSSQNKNFIPKNQHSQHYLVYETVQIHIRAIKQRTGAKSQQHIQTSRTHILFLTRRNLGCSSNIHTPKITPETA